MTSNHLNIHDSTLWRRVKKVYIHDGTTWKPISKIYREDGTSWKKVYLNPVIDTQISDTNITYTSNTYFSIYAQLIMNTDGTIDKVEGPNPSNVIEIGKYVLHPDTDSGENIEVRMVWTFAGTGPTTWTRISSNITFGVVQHGNGINSAQGSLYVRNADDPTSETLIGVIDFYAGNGYGSGGGDPPPQ